MFSWLTLPYPYPHFPNFPSNQKRQHSHDFPKSLPWRPVQQQRLQTLQPVTHLHCSHPSAVEGTTDHRERPPFSMHHPPWQHLESVLQEHARTCARRLLVGIAVYMGGGIWVGNHSKNWKNTGGYLACIPKVKPPCEGLTQLKGPRVLSAA